MPRPTSPVNPTSARSANKPSAPAATFGIIHSSRRFVCDICGQGKHSLNALNSRKRKHIGEKPYVCELCGKSFRCSSGLHVHNFSHTSGKPYSCPICRESFAHNYLRKRHLLTHETDAVVSEKDSQGDVSFNADVQQNENLIIQQLSPNSQDMATISQLGNLEQTSSLEEPLMQETSADQATCHPPPRMINRRLPTRQRISTRFWDRMLINGRGSRRTPVDSLVLPLCDGTYMYKSLKDLQRKGIESDDLPRH